MRGWRQINPTGPSSAAHFPQESSITRRSAPSETVGLCVPLLACRVNVSVTLCCHKRAVDVSLLHLATVVTCRCSVHGLGRLTCSCATGKEVAEYSGPSQSTVHCPQLPRTADDVRWDGTARFVLSEGIPQGLYRQVPTRQQCEPTGSAAAIESSTSSILHPSSHCWQRGTCTAVFCIYLEVGTVPAASCRTKTTSSKKQNKKRKKRKQDDLHAAPATRVMPKKRHLNKYSKPQSTAPSSLSSTAARRNDSHQGASSPCPAAPTRPPRVPIRCSVALASAHTHSRVFLRVLELAPWSCLR